MRPRQGRPSFYPRTDAPLCCNHGEAPAVRHKALSPQPEGAAVLLADDTAADLGAEVAEEFSLRCRFLYGGGVIDPSSIPDDSCLEGHLDAVPVYQVMLALGEHSTTGRLSIADSAGDNHMYFMRGAPVGVHLAEHFHPIGQLLLELGRMNGATFVRAQRLISERNRMPGQVYKELGILDDTLLKEVLTIQAKRKAEHFCRLSSRPFTFCRGLAYLTGFTSTPLDAHSVIFLAVRQQMGEQSREAWFETTRGEQVQLVPPGPRPQENCGLPAPLASFGFGAPEERFLQRLLAGFEAVSELAETGTLPRDEMAVLLRYLEVIGRLQRRPLPPAPTLVPPPQPSAVPAMISAIHSDMAELQDLAFTEQTSEDVFKRPAHRSPPPLADASLFAGPQDATNPARPAAEPPPRASAAVSVSEDDELQVPVTKKKKPKRLEPLPSERSGVLVSETRRERTEVAPRPSIVIDDD